MTSDAQPSSRPEPTDGPSSAVPVPAPAPDQSLAPTDAGPGDAVAADTTPEWDVVVVGGGAAGLAAALTLSRARRRVLVLDAGEPRNSPADGVHGYLGREGTSPLELLRIGRTEVESYGGVVRSARVADVRRTGGDDADPTFAVTLADVAGATDASGGTDVAGATDASGASPVTADGTAATARTAATGTAGAPDVSAVSPAEDAPGTVTARRVVVATGLVDDLPDVPGLAERWGRDVVHCPFCHGWEVRERRIGVLGSNATAVHQALLFRGWSDDVTLFVHDAPDPTDDEWEQLAARGVQVVTGRVAGLVVEDDALTGVRLVDGPVVGVDAVATSAVFRVADAVLAPLGLGAEEHPSGIATVVSADAVGRAAPGVWVAGNLADPMAQVIGAAASGNRVGAAVVGDLLAAETRAAVASRRARGTPDAR